MQELLDKIGHALEALWTFGSLLQLALLAAITAVTIFMGRRVRKTAQARALEMQPGFTSRVGEGLIIVSPHSTALLLVAAALGILHVLHRPTDILVHALTLVSLLLAIRTAVY